MIGSALGGVRHLGSNLVSAQPNSALPHTILFSTPILLRRSPACQRLTVSHGIAFEIVGRVHGMNMQSGRLGARLSVSFDFARGIRSISKIVQRS